MTKAKYYVEFHWYENGWMAQRRTFTRAEAQAVAAEMNSKGMKAVRIRHKGRTIARWQDGRRVGK